MVIQTMQLGVEKYISDRESSGRLPSRALVSLDIVNMFNAISRERLREIIAADFPSLEGFADMLYDEDGETYVKMEDGSWAVIPVTEGFAQGCPVSPLFAAIVLNSIIQKIQPMLETKAKERLRNNDTGDDSQGTIGLIMAYVDDVNILLHHDDVEFFLDTFNKLATPLGGVLNVTKTRIMTSTSNKSLVDIMLASPDENIVRTGESLDRAITAYSKKLEDGQLVKEEIVTGLRVLGAPLATNPSATTLSHLP
jgi:hypothetical protein